MGLLASNRIPRYQRGMRLHHAHFNELVRLADRETRGINVMSDGMGTMIWNRRVKRFQLTRLMLAEDHPGWGEVFMCYKGIWHSDTCCWTWDCGDGCDDLVYAIDWFWAGEEDWEYYPDEGATGLFVPRACTTFGTIWECVSMDCESKGACGTVNEAGSGSGTGAYCVGTYSGAVC